MLFNKYGVALTDADRVETRGQLKMELCKV